MSFEPSSGIFFNARKVLRAIGVSISHSIHKSSKRCSIKSWASRASLCESEREAQSAEEPAALEVHNPPSVHTPPSKLKLQQRSGYAPEAISSVVQLYCRHEWKQHDVKSATDCQLETERFIDDAQNEDNVCDLICSGVLTVRRQEWKGFEAVNHSVKERRPWTRKSHTKIGDADEEEHVVIS